MSCSYLLGHETALTSLPPPRDTLSLTVIQMKEISLYTNSSCFLEKFGCKICRTNFFENASHQQTRNKIPTYSLKVEDHIQEIVKRTLLHVTLGGQT